MKIQRFDDDILQVNALLARQVDLITTADLLGYELKADNPDKDLEIKFVCNVETEHMCFRPGDYALRDWCDTWILSNYTQGNLARWWDEYMDFPMPLGDLPSMATPLVPGGGI
jgi:hypothetical protein